MVDAAALKIVIYPDPVLSGRAAEIREVNDTVRAVAARVIELMYEAEGIGLAAPQVGVPWRMFVTRGPEEGDPDRIFINPALTILDKTLVDHDEGCLSLPGITAEVRRPRGVSISALDAQGQPFSLKDDDFTARVWQHEFDHLEGILIIDRQSVMDRLANRKLIKALEERAG